MKIVEQDVKLIDVMGTDLTVANAARVSFHKHSVVLSASDEKLIAYLAKHNHWTPFGHCMATFRLKTPIFVARQLFKHQVGLVVNEVSRRYVDDEPEFFMPEFWRSRPEGGMKQGSGTAIVTNMEYDRGNGANLFAPVTEVVATMYRMSVDVYHSMIKSGVAPEQARMVLPQGMMTEWYWTGSLAAWARVYKLRCDPHAQGETQEIGYRLSLALRSEFPVSWPALLTAPLPTESA